MDDRFIFRAKSLDHHGNKLKAGDWVYGAYTAYCMAGSPSEFEDEHGTYPAIYAPEIHDVTTGGVAGTSRHSRWVRVDPGTVGQCTGLKDKNGKLVFEEDIVNRLKPDALTGEHIVIWANLKWMLSRIGKLNPDIHSENNFFPIINVRNEFLEIIGNIHDNPDLLKRKEAQ